MGMRTGDRNKALSHHHDLKSHPITTTATPSRVYYVWSFYSRPFAEQLERSFVTRTRHYHSSYPTIPYAHVPGEKNINGTTSVRLPRNGIRYNM